MGVKERKGATSGRDGDGGWVRAVIAEIRKGQGGERAEQSREEMMGSTGGRGALLAGWLAG